MRQTISQNEISGSEETLVLILPHRQKKPITRDHQLCMSYTQTDMKHKHRKEQVIYVKATSALS